MLKELLRGTTMKIGILNDFKGQHVVAIKACQELNVDYEEIDIISSNCY